MAESIIWAVVYKDNCDTLGKGIQKAWQNGTAIIANNYDSQIVHYALIVTQYEFVRS